jgi:hypothetical protein
MNAPKLDPGDLDDSDLREMEGLLSAAAGGARVSLSEEAVAALLDILMPRGANAPTIDESTPARLLAVLWRHGAPPIADLAKFAADVQSTLEGWHLLH